MEQIHCNMKTKSAVHVICLSKNKNLLEKTTFEQHHTKGLFDIAHF